MGLVIGGLSDNISALFLYKVNGVNYSLIYGYGLWGHTLRCMQVGGCMCGILLVTGSEKRGHFVQIPNFGFKTLITLKL